MPPTSLGLIVPLGSDSDPTSVAALVDARVIDSVWVRDLPAVAPTDPDTGQRSDPWWYLGRLLGAGVRPDYVGTASIILGLRHPLVVARAAAGAQIDSAGRFVLGVGTGGKDPMNRALGIAGRPHVDFAAQWRELRAALRGLHDGGVGLALPPGLPPPPVHLASSDVERWRVIDGDADGWQTFLTDDLARFREDHAQVCALRGGPTEVGLRLDVELVGSDVAAAGPEFTLAARGRVRCTAGQLPALVRPWLGEPVRRLLLRLTGHAPEKALRLLERALA